MDAVIAEDDQSYSWAAIQGWFETGARTSPMTGVDMGTTLRLNLAVRGAVATFLSRYKGGDGQLYPCATCHNLNGLFPRLHHKMPPLCHAKYD